MSLDPKNSFESFNNDNICKLAKEFYSEDFIDQDIIILEYELIHCKQDVMHKSQFNVSTIVSYANN